MIDNHFWKLKLSPGSQKVYGNLSISFTFCTIKMFVFDVTIGRFLADGLMIFLIFKN